MKKRSARAATILSWVALVAAVTPLTATDPGPPARLEIEPNAILERDETLTIEVGGISMGERVRLRVLRDCDGDGRPDPGGEEGCCNPIYERDSEAADPRDVVHDRLVFADLDKKCGDLHGVRLWLRASRPGSEQGLLARFGLVEDPCSLWATVIETFLGGECDPGLRQALRRHRGPSGLEMLTFEVRLLEVPSEVPATAPEPMSVPDTRGATGVAWLDPETLVFTTAPTADEGGVPLLPGTPEEVIEPGLYRIDLNAEEPKRELLWLPPDAWLPTAPLPLGDGRIAFARQRLGEHDDRPVAWLSIWKDGTVDARQDVALDYKIHQLLAANAEGTSILALTLGVEANRPGLLMVDLGTKDVEHVGFHNGLYQAAMRRPGGRDALVALEDNSGRNGWDLVLVDAEGEWLRNVQKRQRNDLLPAWRPDGDAVALLAEVRR